MPVFFTRRTNVEINGLATQAFAPGDPITGTVDYLTRAEDIITLTTVDFRGTSRVKVKAADGTIRKESVELFHHKETLFSGEQVVPPRQSIRWPFTFAFPFFTGPDKSGAYPEEGSSKFIDTPHQLPPSVSQQDAGEPVEITYTLFAVVLRSYRAPQSAYFWSEGIHKVIEDLQVRPVVVPDSVRVSDPGPMEEMLTLMSADTRRPSLTQRRWSVATNTVTQTHMPFKAIVDAPNLIVLGKDITISYQVQSERANTDLDAPSVCPCSLKTAKVSLRAHTHWRATEGQGSRVFTDTKTKVLGTVQGPSKSQAAEQNLMFKTDAVKDFPPSFKSYSISRSYSLHVHMTFTCKGQKGTLEATFERPEIRVVREDTNPARLERTAPYTRVIETIRLEEDDELPSYGERLERSRPMLQPTRAPLVESQ